ncbi:bacteriohemerythrin [Glaciimonas sp. PCH181]|uniref:bacteriohemerythrin n=1 Tax=Glaciimonas sp. PCH181 TaxID=2133943 RepID=UPI000D3A0A20|nr:hemerythrin domain-containing protein [Glaciimonas sp. PCH181]PUA19697.1 hemerythrin [Glaciimonas sp. PCH181]
MTTPLVRPDNESNVICWDDTFLVGYPPLDRVHEEFVNSLAALQRATDDALAELFDAMAGSAGHQFEQEDKWMNETVFPPRDCHVKEHAAVMESIGQVRERIVQGDLAEGRRLANALADWFPAHSTHLDSALAHWIFKLRLQGKPVVLRRGAVRQS